MLHHFIQQHLIQHNPITLLVVIASKGSSPGRRGFKMAVAADGTMEGSIGGGKMEIGLVNQVLAEMQHGKAENHVIRQVHQSHVPDSSGMICSGEQTVLCFALSPKHLPVFQATSGILCINETEIWVAESPQPPLSRGDMESPPDKEDSKDLKHSSILYQETIQQKLPLYIVGGGHCALALSELASKLDFEVHLLDDRPHLNTIHKNKFAQVRIIEDYAQIATHIPVAIPQFVVVMTVGFVSDEVVVRALFERDFAYFGVLGSKAKIATLWKRLRLDGFDETRLNQIKAPIGLPIGSQTPMEIAISILAEMIQTKRALNL